MVIRSLEYPRGRGDRISTVPRVLPEKQGGATVDVQYREDTAETYCRVLPQWQCNIERISPDVPKGTSAQSLLEALVAQISCGLAREIRAREKINKSYVVHSAG